MRRAFVAVDLQARVAAGRSARPSTTGDAGGQRRQDRQHEADRRVQPAELALASSPNGRLRCTALQVGPAVAAAVEDAVEGRVDRVVARAARAAVSRCGSIQGCIAGRHEPRAERLEQAVDAPHVRAGRPPAARSRRGAGPLVLSSTTCRTSSLDQAIGPRSTSRDVLAGDRRAGARRQTGRTSSVVAVDDHVLQLDAVALEQTQPPAAACPMPSSAALSGVRAP